MSYLLESSICLAVLYGFYYLLLKTDKFLTLQRIYLLLSLILSLLIPLIETDLPTPNYTPSIMDFESPEPTVTTNSLPWSIIDYVKAIYWIGVFIMTLRTCSILLRIIKIIKRGERLTTKGYTIIYSSENIPVSSFFNYIFIPQSQAYRPKDFETIMIHEKKHISDRHSIDLLTCQILKIFFWFNPAVYMISGSLRAVHEYICDEEVIKYVSVNDYEELLVDTLFKKINAPVISQFNEVSLKNRIAMINRKNPSKFKQWKFSLILPVVMMLIWSCKLNDNELSEAAKNEKYTLSGKVLSSTGKPVPGTNVVIKGTTMGTVTDMEGNYQLEVSPDHKELVFSFVGFETQVQQIGDRSTLDIVLEADGSASSKTTGKIIPSKSSMKGKTLHPSEKLISENGSYFLIGKVLDENDQPLAGINVVLVDHKIGTVTNREGNYKIEVPVKSGQVLYSFIGFDKVYHDFN